MSKVNPVKRVAPKPEADKTRIIFKHVLETIRSLDEISKGKTALRDVYSAESIQLRRRLKEYCERLLFVSPVEYGRKTEELLWRKAFYDVIQVMKLIRKNGRPSRAVESAYENHLSAAAGFYCHLLFRLQREFKLELWSSLDFGYQGLGRIGRSCRAVPGPGNASIGNSVDPRARQWAERACQRCLVYLGDLARYHKDFVGDRSWILAQRYYYQAFLLNPDNGMPHNQLGTLAGTRYYGLDAAYHYIRCLCSATKFDGANGNLERIFEKNRKRYQELGKASSQRHLSIEQQKLKDVRRLCIRFLRLMDMLYNNSASVEPRELQLLCQDLLQDFSLCLFYTASEPGTDATAKSVEESLGEEKMAYLEDEVIAKIVILIIIVVHKLQSLGSKQVAAAIAFNLALFSHILNHVRLRLQSSLDKMGQFDPSTSTATTPAPGSDDDRCTPTADLNDGPRAVALATTGMGDSESSSISKLPVSDLSLNYSSRARHHKRKLASRRRRRRSNSEDSSEDLSEGEANTPQRTTAALAAMISDEEEEMNYLNKRRHGNGADDDTLSTSSEASACSSSSSSSSSSGGIGMLMESQELRPGFLSGTASTEQAADDSLERSVLALQKSLAASSGPMSLQALLKSGSALPATVGSSSGFVGNEDDLQRLSFDLLTRAEASADVSTSGVGSSNGNSETSTACNGSAHRPVRVPPGFNNDDPEVRHVKEINDKLATYVIDTDTNSSIPTESDTAEGESSGDESIVARPHAGAATPRNEKSFNRLLSVIANEGLMPTVKILCDWLRWQPQIVSTCIQSSPSLWSRMASFLNFLPHEHDLSSCEDLFRLVSVLRHVRLASECGCSAEKWKQRYSLREDVHLRKLAAVSAAHASIDFEDRLDITSIEEAAMRVCHLRMFGYHMAASTASTSSFTYDAQLATFVGPGNPTAMMVPATIATSGVQGGNSRPLTQAATSTEVIDNSSRKNQLMRDMAQLRLQAEVSELEDSVKKFAEPSSVGSLPPYVVLDTPALCEYYLLVQQLVASARFIVIVPQAVIDQLDEMKKEAVSARDAIRWLEAEFQKGNRHIRAQRTHERTSNQGEQVVLRRKDKETWRALELIDCCKYLVEHHAPSGTTTVVGTASSIAVLLMGGDIASMSISLPPALAVRTLPPTAIQATAAGMQVPPVALFSDVANRQGVTVCNIGQFFERWKQASKTKG